MTRPASARAIQGSGEGETPSRPAGRARSRLWWFASIGAFVLTLWALVLDLTTFAINDYTNILVMAIACACGAMVLIGACWRRMTVVGRGIAGIVLVGDLWVLVDAGGRRLLGW